MRIAENFRAATEGPQGANWHLYEALAGRPVPILRGDLSDLLSAEMSPSRWSSGWTAMPSWSSFPTSATRPIWKSRKRRRRWTGCSNG